MKTASVQYPEGLPQALKTSDEAFQRELGFLAAAKLFELGRISSGVAAQIAGVSRVEFLRRLDGYGIAAMDLQAEEIAAEVKRAQDIGGRVG